MTKKSKKPKDDLDTIISGALEKTEKDKKSRKKEKDSLEKDLDLKIKDALLKKREEEDDDEDFGFEDERQMFEEGGMFFLGARNQTLRQSGQREDVGSLEDSLPIAPKKDPKEEDAVRYTFGGKGTGLSYEAGKNEVNYNTANQVESAYKEFSEKDNSRLYKTGISDKKEDREKDLTEANRKKNDPFSEPSRLEETIDKESKKFQERYGGY